jgi:hypothetical protein
MRCICCNSKFVPAILYNPDGSFHSFEEYCPKCIEASQQEATDIQIEKEWHTNYTGVELFEDNE